ncbi:RNA polymerase sigma-70 factor [Anaeromyxobacter oryzae]|uniref:RNA polymerase subunit sigma-24 n=1 Tax=Anaeromyxobacter oryzae TaxID=2918170 RepID=A0ABM7WUF3_9BACT|nr:RNA polymerase sigma-70 factor [Anaeromyxobacter oryzae]BDG03128.1 RNA polymerase subunit sigma-24 [Anaeromyxobacter oryzae]
MNTTTYSEDAPLERYRPRLFGIAFRMLGDVQDAEDLVQETMLRWQSTGRENAREPEAWLVAVVTRLAIDRLRQAQARRALYPGPWLPEPVAEERLSPEYRSELASDLSMAFLVLLERLAPEERAAFLLRDVFGCDYDEIARTLAKTQAAARQTVHRARERVRADRPRFAAPPEAKERLLGRFIAALESGDRDALLDVFAEDVTWTSDGGGKVTAARRTLHGAARIARMLAKLAAKYGMHTTYRFVRLNGEPAVLEYMSGRLFAATFCETDGARVHAMYRVLNPEKLGHVG